MVHISIYFPLLELYYLRMNAQNRTFDFRIVVIELAIRIESLHLLVLIFNVVVMFSLTPLSSVAVVRSNLLAVPGPVGCPD